MQALGDAFLRLRTEVDQKVAASDQIHFRKGRILEKIVLREDAHVPHQLADLEAAINLDEEALPSRHGDSFDGRFLIDAFASPLHCRFAQVRSEDLQGRLDALAGAFEDGHGQRIHFFACGATRRPDAQGIARLSSPQEPREYRSLEGVEDFLFAKESGDVDQDVLRQRLQLDRVLDGAGDVLVYLFDPPDGHAALNAAYDGTAPVSRKIHTCRRSDRGVEFP